MKPTSRMIRSGCDADVSARPDHAASARVVAFQIDLTVLLNHARLIGFLNKEHGNPAKGIPLFKQPSEGWEPWPDDVRSELSSWQRPARVWFMSCRSGWASASATR